MFWKNKIINYKESELTFLFNAQKLDKNLTLLEYGIGNSVIKVIEHGNLKGGWFDFRDILYWIFLILFINIYSFY